MKNRIAMATVFIALFPRLTICGKGKVEKIYSNDSELEKALDIIKMPQEKLQQIDQASVATYRKAAFYTSAY